MRVLADRRLPLFVVAAVDRMAQEARTNCQLEVRSGQHHMKIVNDWPPNIDEIRDALSLGSKHVVFTYGDTIYNPYADAIDIHLIRHEEVHSKQQLDAGGPENWWAMYLEDPEFRLAEELEAYKVQYRSMAVKHKDRNYRARFLSSIASHLSSPMYGCCISYKEALRRIRTAT